MHCPSNSHQQATGTLGCTLIPALIKAGFEVTAISRGDKSHHLTSFHDVVLKNARYDDIVSLTAALQGQDALIEAFNPAAAYNQATIVRAALAAGVKHILTPDFSSDTFNPHVDELLIFDGKRRAQKDLENVVTQSGDKISWTAIIVGGWYDWGISNGVFWVNKNDKAIMRFGSGYQKYAISHLLHVADFVVHVLQHTDKFRNRPAYFASHTVTTNQLIEIVKAIGGDEWRVIDVDVSSFVEIGRQAWARDTQDGVQNRVATQAWAMLGTAALFHEENRYGGDFGSKLEKGWDEGLDKLKASLEQLLTKD